jgi:hypothetical protein
MINSFDTFGDLPLALQQEAIREGERLLDAQFTAATAADQRALTWAGFLIAAATAALAGGVALFNKKPVDPLLGYSSIIFAISMLRAAWLAIKTVRPSKFAFPGNHPANWLPHEWDCVGTDQDKLKAASIDQARSLENCICENRDIAASKAGSMRESFQWAVWSVVAAGLLLLSVVTGRTFTIQEPTSEIIRQTADEGLALECGVREALLTQVISAEQINLTAGPRSVFGRGAGASTAS